MKLDALQVKKSEILESLIYINSYVSSKIKHNSEPTEVSPKI